jgi:RNA polymerase sigma factor (TIGR02999 family)
MSSTSANPGGGSAHRLSTGFGAVYPQLRAMARSLMRRERASHTLQPTAVVSEAFLRLAGRENDAPFESEAHLMAYAATTMRAVLVDHARRRNSKKRGMGGAADCGLLDAIAPAAIARTDLLEIDDALKALEAADPRAARVVEARVFGGMTIEEVAEAMQLSLSSVSRDWRFGRAFLSEQLSDELGVGPSREAAATQDAGGAA